MQYLGDFAASDTVEFSFNTRTAAGAPITLAGGALAVYKDAGTTALTLSPAPVLDTDVGPVTGLHHVTLALTDADLVAGSDYSIVLSAGTVDGTSVAGTVLAQFSIENRVTLSTAEAASVALITSAGSVTVTSPVTATGDVTIIQGDSYSASEVAWTDSGATWPDDLDAATAILCCIADEAELPCTYAAGTITLDALSCIETAALAAGRYPYWLEAQWDGSPDTIKTIGRGTFNIRRERPEVTA
jgi:hypothetical protein